MAPVKPLQKLLDEADAMIKHASVTPIEVSSSGAVTELTDLLASTEQSVEVSNQDQELSPAEFEKAAEAYNRVQVAAVIDCAARFDVFEKRAAEDGFTKEQIEDALLKIASEQVVKNLPLMVSTVGMISGMGPHAQNALPKKPSKRAYTQMLGDRDLTQSVGGLK